MLQCSLHQRRPSPSYRSHIHPTCWFQRGGWGGEGWQAAGLFQFQCSQSITTWKPVVFIRVFLFLAALILLRSDSGCPLVFQLTFDRWPGEHLQCCLCFGALWWTILVFTSECDDEATPPWNVVSFLSFNLILIQNQMFESFWVCPTDQISFSNEYFYFSFLSELIT